MKWLALWCLAPAIAAAEPAEDFLELGGDRPDFTESPVVVPPKAFQVEGGLTWQRSDSETASFDAPELALRYGVGKRFELRLALPNYVNLVSQGTRVIGAGDPLFGFKYEAGPLPTKTDLAVIVQASLPVGSHELSSNRVDPEVTVPFSHSFGDSWALNGQGALFFPTEDGTRDTVFEPTLSVSYDFSQRSSGFVEYIGDFSRMFQDFSMLHIGTTYQPLPRFQWDVHAGFGITGAAPEFFIGAGFVWRPIGP